MLARSARICSDEVCQEYSTLLYKAIDENAPPCHNFYNHICNVWTSTVRDPLFTHLERRYAEKMMNMTLNIQVPDVGQNGLQKAARYFQSCYSTMLENKSHVKEVVAVLDQGHITWFRNNTDASFLDVIFYMSSYVRMDVILDIKVRTTPTSSRVTFMASGRFLSLLRKREEIFGQKRYGEYFRSFYVHFDHMTGKDYSAYFDEILAAEKELLPLLKQFNEENVWSEQVEGTVDMLRTYAPSLSKEMWKAAFAKFYNLSGDSYNVTIMGDKYFEAVFKAHARVNATRFRNYAGWICLQRLVEFMDRDTLLSYYGDRTTMEQEHQRVCYHRTTKHFLNAFGANLIAEIASAAVRKDVDHLIQNIRAAFDAVISRNSWFQEKSDFPSDTDGSKTYLWWDLDEKRPENYEHVYAAYPDMVNDPLRNWMLVEKAPKPHQTAGRRLNKHKNHSSYSEELSLALEPIYLSVPAYALTAPVGIKLGGLGSIAAAQLFHILFKNKASWSNDTTSRFQEQLQCIVATGQPTNLPKDQDEQYLLLERVSAVPVLWSALEKLVGEEGHALLAKQPALNDARLFYTMFCYLSCGDRNAETRCNLPLRNSPHFAQTYSCAEGAFMRPKHPCNIFA